MAVTTSVNLRSQVIYSVYVRNYSEEGTFAAVERDLDRIRSLGVDILWFLPIYPIGKVKRKGTLGSPYAIADYRKVNPELGTMEDFRHLVEEIHKRGMKCMLDIVYNHTSPDSYLAKHHPEYFYRTPEGTMGNRVGDWGDVVDLDYSSKDLWDYQIDTLKMWAELVDGFRCDVAPLVPLAFWQKAREEVSRVNPECIWLSESVEPEFIVELRGRGMTALSDSEIFQAFDLCYDYDIHKFFRSYLRGEVSLGRYAEAVNMQESMYPANYVKLRYLENHDQDRAQAIIPSSEALINWTAFMYFQKGTALLYAGQENRNQKRPDLFEKRCDLSGWKAGYFRSAEAVISDKKDSCCGRQQLSFDSGGGTGSFDRRTPGNPHAGALTGNLQHGRQKGRGFRKAFRRRLYQPGIRRESGGQGRQSFPGSLSGHHNGIRSVKKSLDFPKRWC